MVNRTGLCCRLPVERPVLPGAHNAQLRLILIRRERRQPVRIERTQRRLTARERKLRDAARFIGGRRIVSAGPHGPGRRLSPNGQYGKDQLEGGQETHNLMLH